MQIDEINARLAAAGSEEIVRWAADTFGEKLVMSSSFGAESAIMLHLVTRVVPGIPVIVIDTGYFFRKTYKFMKKLRKRLALNLKIYVSPISPKDMEHAHGKLWETDMEAYNAMRKAEPMDRALRELGVAGWLTGRRADQTTERASLNIVEDNGDGVIKVNPILGWTANEIDRYLKRLSLPYHPLVRRGFASIGDWHSTKPGKGREGRFVGAEKKVCGLHRQERQT